jgi:hypothetical protein
MRGKKGIGGTNGAPIAARSRWSVGRWIPREEGVGTLPTYDSLVNRAT